MSLCRLSGNFPAYLETFQAFNLVPFQRSFDLIKHFTAITCFIAITYKILCRKVIYAHLSLIVSNKTYALFHLESFCKKSPLPGKFSSFPPLPNVHRVLHSPSGGAVREEVVVMMFRELPPQPSVHLSTVTKYKLMFQCFAIVFTIKS